jgi:hypothetical protein
MLSQRDEAIIASGMNSCDHDYFAGAGLAGEPYLRRGHLCYFDGCCVEVVGIPLAPAEPDSALRSRMQRVIDEWADDPSVTYINYFGPVAVEGPRAPGWLSQYAEDPVPWNLEVSIDLARPILPARKVRQDVRRARRNGIVVSTTQRGYLGHEHIRLITALVERTDMSPDDLSKLTSLMTILRSPSVTMFEARQQDRLCGFLVAHGHFAAAGVVVAAAFDREFRGTSDLLYEAALVHFRDAGFPRLGFGYATEESLFRYKAKWGTPLVGRPFFQQIWASSVALEDLDCLHWQWRLLRDNWRRQCADTDDVGGHGIKALTV